MTNELAANLKQSLGWHKARVDCLVQLTLTLIVTRSVNLKELACVICGEAKLDSYYRRLQRCFSQVTLPRHAVAKLIMGLLFPLGDGVYLSIGRTNGQWGKKNINLLVLSVCYRGAAMPLYWRSLDKKGNSDTNARSILMNPFLEGFGHERVLGVLGDREFVGAEWFAYLINHEIPRGFN